MKLTDILYASLTAVLALLLVLTVISDDSVDDRYRADVGLTPEDENAN